MRDVAERAGVALVTVSRVVNGIGTVREETADRVNAAIREIGYQRNEIARSLRPGQNSMTIGLLLGDLTNLSTRRWRRRPSRWRPTPAMPSS